MKPSASAAIRSVLHLSLLGGCVAVLCGCQTAGQYWRETSSYDATGAFQITDRDVVEPVDLGFLLVRYAPMARANSQDCATLALNTPVWAKGGVANGEDKDGGAFASQDRTRLDRSVQFFACRAAQAVEDERRLARNALQERLMVSSAQRCAAFKIGLQREFSRTNFNLGVLGTIAATAGALVNSASAAKNWAGTAAVSSGVRAEYNQAFLANLAAHVVIQGVDKRRRDVYEQIQREGQSKSYDQYPVEAAIKDAMTFHGQCSVIAGFEEAADAIRLYDDPGVSKATNWIARLKVANTLMKSGEVSNETLLKQISDLNATLPLMAGSRLNTTGTKPPEPRPLVRLDRALKQITEAVKAMEGQLDSLQKKLPPGLDAENLGLTSNFKSHGLEAGLSKACEDRAAGFESDAQVKRARAAAETDAVEQSSLNAEADKADRQGADLAQAATTLAWGFQRRVDSAVAAWQFLFAKAVEDKKAETAAQLKLSIEKAPKLNEEAVLPAMRQLCGK
ncbi:hypothetical protein [Kinneretia aquatilis]|uniref:hypothetical protein n=1 Tax=Kinneretia aquatilis TaxID=2070761 RepID=UPI001056EBC5|nr:hypothetical protein [Paucibacter aquatile]